MDPGTPIVQLINFLLERGRASRVVSIGGVSALDLPLDCSLMERRHIDPHCFSDLVSNADLLRGAIVLCLSTFDSLAEPQPLLDALARARDNADFMLFSVKDRVRHSGFLMGMHSAEPPVWVAETFAQALYNAGFSEHCLMGYIADNSTIEAKQSFLVMAGREAAPPKLQPESFEGPTVAAVINTYNELDIIETVVRYLSEQGIAVHLVDNWSTDGTYEKCEHLLRSGTCASLQRFPGAPSEHYQWVEQLNNTAQFAATLDADWVLHYDADEIRCAPWRGLSLREGIAFVDSLGYNAIDFTVLNFAFTDAISPERFCADQLPFYEFGRDPPYFSQVKAWRSRDRLVDLSSTGGHEAQFAGRRIFPLKFLTKHYSLRSKAQATRKIFADRLPRFASERQRLGWHTQYDYYAQARAIEPWHPWELLRFDEATFYSDHLLEGIAGIGIERTSLVLPNQRTMVNTVTSLSAALGERTGQLTEAEDRIAALEAAVLDSEQRAETAAVESEQRATQLGRAREQLTEAQSRVAALETIAVESEQRAAQLGRTLDERSAELTRARETIEKINGALAQRDHELALRVKRIDEIKASLSWRLMSPFRELYRAGGRVGTSRVGVKLRAVWRHPAKSNKRKAFRANRMGEYAAARSTAKRRPSKLAARLRALVSHPSSGKLRRAYREELRRDPPPPPVPPSHRPSLVSAIDFSSLAVSAIVPNYNHARFLRERLTSIAEQTLPASEIIILDDASTDDSRQVIADIAANIAIPVRTVFNDRNSGSVFSQWAKGLSLSTGDLMWICESDDTCDRGFLEALVPYFQDQSVMLAFGRIDFIEEDGSLRPGMDQYMESAAAYYWQEPRVESAHSWFQGPFGVRNIIPNVGGCVFRRQRLGPSLLNELTSYKVCGDWHLYSRLAHGGRIAYEPAARAYFRQHRGNTSVSNFKNEAYHEEHIRIAQALRRHYGTGSEPLHKMLHHVYEHYRLHFGDAAALDLKKRYPVSEILAERRTVPHVLIAMQGFQTGGGEMFPINLANAIFEQGCDVSVLIALSSPVNAQMRRLLHPAIPVFTKAFVEKFGVQNFLDEFSVDLIHTHNVGIDKWLHWTCPELRTTYVVTHHGSYECEPVSKETTTWLLENVHQWIYIAEKNLAFAKDFVRNEQAFTKLQNAVPVMDGKFPVSRQDLGIEPNAFIFGLASRAMRAKGWDVAIDALSMLQGEVALPVHLILCGDGEDLAALREAHRDKVGIHFLGYQDKIQAFYRLCDCCVLPTRFLGESYPLTIIEAILAGIPTIATDVGEIRSILKIDTDPMGMTVPFCEDNSVFAKSILLAMRRMLDPITYDQFRTSVGKHQGSFSMDSLVSGYLDIYQRAFSAAFRDRMDQSQTVDMRKL